MPDHAWALLLIGIAAGLLSGMFGIGGGAVMVPALTVIIGFELQQAIGTSLAVMIGPVSIFAVLAYYRAGYIRFIPAGLIALGLVMGSVGGAEIALSLPGETLQRIYGAFLIYTGWRFVEPRKWLAARRGVVTPAPDAVESETSMSDAWYVVLGVGLVAGVASGLFGIGGGLVIVPALIGLLHYDHKRAVATSLVALLPPVSIGAVITFYEAGKIDIMTSLLVAVGLVMGAFSGARVALGLPSALVKRYYGIFLIVISMRFIFQF
ncbi:MAG TPA: sulfite exporter TauE/SafE family protein [Aggregatilinea sp.]|uniref:sulfite exporter TauE/SafE family protein n=1 Tax=Aggregatilinea sp. TaxID=2806333 RepID=UPI002C83696C|nr:sulfite exporter TauE/SafE family protein [Aggregatilinea sp.]HML24219.1 sulfite exporter TauE/SafE family protein [Aggregatilinea sp.]